MTTLDEVRARRCPVCASDDPEVLFDNRMSPIVGIDFSYRVVACGRCSMVYAADAPIGSTLASYYRDSSKYDFGPVGLVHPGDQHRADVAASFTRRWVLPDARILDVGCSIGVYLASLIGGHRIATPDALSRRRDRPVVVSSFHAMRGIVEYLQKNFDNEIVTLYPMHSETTLVS